ncbi:uncharacterized protein BDW47DRAFT_109345 [Aspergillus candidus]|uniref:Uncharacterized protein n=1 Tax=Aspergillus candidus TaxID=41067 RepID=A0A2I2F5V7_ASPCN|nr:hypothetical protein BDW47DRAFT_109345 [Aspergillus candidus]PLB36030.1 hypothetical protein BDW47DRAFT_109345 [Aspergillus candidus]
MNPFTNPPFQDSDSQKGTMSNPRGPFVSFNDGDGALVWYNSYCDPAAEDRVWWLRLAMEGHYTNLGELLFDMTLAYDYGKCQVVPIFNHDMDGSMYMGFNVPVEVEEAGRDKILALGGEHLMRVMAYWKAHKSFPTPVHNAPKDESAGSAEETESEKDEDDTPPTTPEESPRGKFGNVRS